MIFSKTLSILLSNMKNQWVRSGGVLEGETKRALDRFLYFDSIVDSVYNTCKKVISC